MTELLLAEIPYERDSARLFAGLADRPWAIFLDSGMRGGEQGRYDIICADPAATLTTRGEVTEIRRDGSLHRSRRDPFQLVKEQLEPVAEAVPGLPFCGGAAGYFGYDLARRLEPLPVCAHDGDDLPDMAVGIYDWALVTDHWLGRTWLVGQGRDPATRRAWRRRLNSFRRRGRSPVPRPFSLRGPLRSNMDWPTYEQRFRQVQSYIRNGDCYQVNLAQRFAGVTAGDPWQAYCHLRTISRAPFGAYLHIPGARILSASPERFLRTRDGEVETRPIKGTRRRDPEPGRDRQEARALAASVKDRAENLMIVDLLRNDLGKTCLTGSVRAPELFAVESFAAIHHLVSTVSGVLAPGSHALDLLRGCFPGGSITGAPKVRAMQIIEELEPHRRGVYCGSIGYIGFDGAMDTNIAIRTVVHSGGESRFWAGGGIVADSQARAEYRETLDKAAAFMDLVQTQRQAGRPA